MSDALETVKKYVPDADPAVVEKMASTYRLVLQKADAALVSASDPEELKRLFPDEGVGRPGASVRR